MRTRRPAAPAPSPLLPRVVAIVATIVLSAGTVTVGTQAAGSPADGATDAAAATGSGTTAGGARAATSGEPTAAAPDDGQAEARARQRRQVRRVQRRLAALGWYDGAVDGLEGPRTRAAVRGFQRATGLTVDGIAGPATRQALRADDAVTLAAWEASRRDAEPAESTRAPASDTSTSASTSPTSASCDLSCRGRRIVAMVPLPVPASYTVEVRPGRDGYLGVTNSASREIVLYVSDDHTDREVGATLLHEIGHAYDFLGFGGRGDDARRQWARARGIDWDGRDAWYGNGCQGCSDFSIGAGDLAESIHACWAPGWDRFRSQLAGPPTASQCDLLARILR